MKNRPSFEEIMMRMAFLVAERSTCKRLQVGAVICTTDFRRILSMGYNGNYSGGPDTCDSDEPGNCGCIHAEENAVINCSEPRGTNKLIFVTDSPCKMCSKKIINLGNVKTVFYVRDYRITEGRDLLFSVGIYVKQLPTSDSTKQEDAGSRNIYYPELKGDFIGGQ